MYNFWGKIMNQEKIAYVFFATGFEEIEAITPVDILRRAGVNVKTFSISDSLDVKGAHDIFVKCDYTLSQLDENVLPDAVIMPGGMPGATNLANSEKLKVFTQKCFAKNKHTCAICASPAIVFGEYGLLSNKNWTCYPNMENQAPSENLGNWKANPVVVDENLITSRGPGTAAEFSYEILNQLGLGEKATALKQGMLFN